MEWGETLEGEALKSASFLQQSETQTDQWQRYHLCMRCLCCHFSHCWRRWALCSLSSKRRLNYKIALVPADSFYFIDGF